MGFGVNCGLKIGTPSFRTPISPPNSRRGPPFGDPSSPPKAPSSRNALRDPPSGTLQVLPFGDSLRNPHRYPFRGSSPIGDPPPSFGGEAPFGEKGSHPDSAKLFLGFPRLRPVGEKWKKNRRQNTLFKGLPAAIQNWPKKYIFFGPKKIFLGIRILLSYFWASPAYGPQEKKH